MDREKIINAIEKAKKQSEEYAQDRIIVPFKETDMILALLKEQEAVVRCKDCKHRPKEPNWKTYEDGFDIEFPEGSKCPCQCSDDEYYSWYPRDDWFCANGERRTNNV